jgi:signal transduction histidine kinase/HAMP domain-containing protein
MNFGIRQKLFGGFFILIFLFTGTYMVGLYNIQIVVNSLENTLAHPMVVTRASQGIEVLVLSIQRDLYGISLSTDSADMNNLIREIRQKDNQVLGLFSLIQKQIIGNEGKAIALKTRINFYQWRQIRDKTITLAKNGKYKQAQTVNITESDSHVRLLQFELDQLGNYATNKAILLTEDSVRLATNAKIIGVITIILNILISLFISFYLSLSITRRLRSISNVTTLMAKGDIKQTLEITGHDELTQVAANFNTMARELAGMYEDLEKKVKERTIELKETNEELNRMKSDLEGKVAERTKDHEEKINELNRSQLAMLYMIEDMNETSRKLKATQEELIRKERLAILGQFSGNISHELRNPLGVIDSSIYYLQMRLNEKDEKIQQHLERISLSVKTATIIIDNLLNLTRMNKPVLTRYTVADLLTDCLGTCKIPDTVRIVKDLPEKMIWVKAEKEQFRMAVDNLVKNAVAAMNGTGTLTIGVCKTEDAEVEISFLDTGAGIDPDHLNQVFLPLFTTKAKGIGLGLSITKMIVENHGGKIYAQAEPGMGAKFTIRLPFVREELKQPSVEKT